MTHKVVTPRYWEGWNASLLGMFGVGPRFTITCGDCGYTFHKRLPIIDHPRIPCPYCHVLNEIPVYRA